MKWRFCRPKLADVKNFFTPHPDTLPVEGVHPVFHEKWIETGYRVPYRPWSYYLGSLVTFHVETFNIWTHLIGALIVAYHAYGYATTTTDTGCTLFMVSGFCGVYAHLASVGAHWFCSKSPTVYKRVFLFDYGGVSVYNFSCHVLMFYTTYDSRFVQFWGAYAIPFVVILNASVCFLLSYGASFTTRSIIVKNVVNVLSIGTTVSIGCAAMQMRAWHRLATRDCQDCDLEEHILFLILLHGVVAVLSAVSFIALMPERCSRRTFDILGQSHQIFHICVTLQTLLTMRIGYLDIKLGYRTHEEVDTLNAFGSVWWAVLAMFLLSWLFTACFMPYVYVRVSRDKGNGSLKMK
ncbi:membrane progestin receptor beta-like [Lineus longissimus]|uniref:membrane progestin receptor beta-like n=1 Tax=Lineus longissimus TaxID=88925 RepID=UPI00315DAC3D